MSLPTTQELIAFISSTVDGPVEGSDYYIDDDGLINVDIENVGVAGSIIRQVNQSKLYSEKMVRITVSGDTIILGFDTIRAMPSVYTLTIGKNKDTLAEVKEDGTGKFCFYLNDRRNTRTFRKLATAKRFIKDMDKELKKPPIDIEETQEDDIIDFKFEYDEIESLDEIIG